jgi:hypothetical protein
VVVISHHYWQQILSADPAIVGKTISVNSTPFTVVGVMPEAFHGFKQELEPPDLWVPITMVEQIMLQPNMLTPRSFYFLHMFARRSAQSTLSADQAWLDRQIHDYVRVGEGATICCCTTAGDRSPNRASHPRQPRRLLHANAIWHVAEDPYGCGRDCPADRLQQPRKFPARAWCLSPA